MSALIYNIDKYSCQVLAKRLQELGYSTVLEARTPAQCQHFLKREQAKIQLIVYCSNRRDSFRFQVFPLLRSIREMAAIPLVLVSETFAIRSGPIASRSHDLPRADYVLNRPFGRRQLLKAIVGAHERRNRKRDVAVIYSATEPMGALESIYYDKLDTHWHKIEWAKNIQELSTIMREQDFRVGTLFIAPDDQASVIVPWLLRFKKTRLGAITPVAFLSRDPSQIEGFRTVCDFFASTVRIGSESSDADWSNLLTLASHRLLAKRKIHDLVKELRSKIKLGQYKNAHSELLKLTSKYPFSWELIEILGQTSEKLGRWQEALDQYQKALALNPCAPASHLGRLRLIRGGEFDISRDYQTQFQLEALHFCPRHPQVRDSLIAHQNPSSNMVLESPTELSL